MERIGERTKLDPELVRVMLESGVCCTIGTADYKGLLRKHLLLYSCLDDDYFVAILDRTETVLVTLVPVERVSFRGFRIGWFHRRTAQQKWQESDLSKTVIKEETPMEIGEALLEVRVNDVTEFTLKLGNIPKNPSLTSQTLTQIFYDSLSAISKGVAVWMMDNMSKKVRYHVLVKCYPDTHFEEAFCLRHRELFRRLQGETSSRMRKSK